MHESDQIQAGMPRAGPGGMVADNEALPNIRIASGASPSDWRRMLLKVTAGFGLVIVVCIGAIQSVGTNANSKFNQVAETLKKPPMAPWPEQAAPAPALELQPRRYTWWHDGRGDDIVTLEYADGKACCTVLIASPPPALLERMTKGAAGWPVVVRFYTAAGGVAHEERFTTFGWMRTAAGFDFENSNRFNKCSPEAFSNIRTASVWY